MPYIKTIPLSEIKVVRNLQDVQVGALLQIATGNAEPFAEIGLHTILQAANGSVHGIVFLEGRSAGQFITHEELLNRPVIDVSDLVHIVLVDPAPHNVRPPAKIVAGDVVQASDRDEKTFLGIAFKPLAQASIEGYVYLSGKKRGQNIKVVDQLYIGRAAVVPLDEPSNH
ncbi:MAG: hypothetical protein ACLPSW_35930 [Roseiarcus sp.]